MSDAIDKRGEEHGRIVLEGVSKSFAAPSAKGVQNGSANRVLSDISVTVDALPPNLKTSFSKS